MAGITVTGTKSILDRLSARSFSGKKTANAEVGFSAPYATYVHENLTIPHKVGQAKFLETAIRVNLNQFYQIVAKNLKNKESLVTALTRASNFILAEAKKLTPVKTGRLRDSGYVRVV